MEYRLEPSDTKKHMHNLNFVTMEGVWKELKGYCLFVSCFRLSNYRLFLSLNYQTLEAGCGKSKRRCSRH